MTLVLGIFPSVSLCLLLPAPEHTMFLMDLNPICKDGIIDPVSSNSDAQLSNILNLATPYFRKKGFTVSTYIYSNLDAWGIAYYNRN